MSILMEVLKELLSMFLADARLTGAVLVLVGAVALAIGRGGVDPLVGGGALMAGCLVILAVVTTLQARRR